MNFGDFLPVDGTVGRVVLKESISLKDCIPWGFTAAYDKDRDVICMWNGERWVEYVNSETGKP